MSSDGENNDAVGDGASSASAAMRKTMTTTSTTSRNVVDDLFSWAATTVETIISSPLRDRNNEDDALSVVVVGTEVPPSPLARSGAISRMEKPIASDAAEICFAIPDAIHATASHPAAFKSEEEVIARPQPLTKLLEKHPTAFAPTYPDDDNDAGRSKKKVTDDILVQVKSDEQIVPAGLGGIQIGAPAEIHSRLIHSINTADANVVATWDHLLTAEPQPASFIRGGKRKYNKRKSEVSSLRGDKCAEIGESDKARDEDADSFGAANVDDSPSPAKKTKSEDDDKVGEDGNARASRQCHKCSKVLHFRSERSAIGGYKLHVSRCRISIKHEDVSHVMKGAVPHQKLAEEKKDAVPCQEPAEKRNDVAPHQKPADETQIYAVTKIYSLTKDPISSRDLMYLRPRKFFIKPPDPRPCYGCNWCGPDHQNNVVGDNETLCPACKLLSDDGWVRWCDNVAKKVFFLIENEKKCSSIRDFLCHTTVILGEKLAKMSPEERVALYSTLHVLDEGIKENETPKARPQSSLSKRVKTSKATVVDISPPELAGAVKSKLARRCEYVRKDVAMTAFHYTTLTTRKKSVRGLDPRPSFGCEWCGVMTKSGDETPNDLGGELCPICDALKDFGYRGRIYSTARSFTTSTNETIKGVKAYLLGTTDIVAEAVKLLSAPDHALLQAKYKHQAYDLHCKEIVSADILRKRTKKMSCGDRSALQTKNKSAITGAKKSSITAKKKSNGVTPNRSRLSKSISGITNVTKERNVTVKNDVAQLSLPTIPQLLESNLSVVLKADVFCVYNSHFGTNSNIAAKILLALSEGQLPSCISTETPFLRSIEEILTLTCASGTPPSRFVGVYRVKKTLGGGKYETSFGAALPEFYVNCEWSSAIERTPNGHIVPKVATVNGQPLLLRIGIDDEEVAGKLFSFCYRIMYGAVAASDIVAERNSRSKPACQDSKTTTPLPPSVHAKTDPPQDDTSSKSFEIASSLKFHGTVVNMPSESLCDQDTQDTFLPIKGSIVSQKDSPKVDASGTSHCASLSSIPSDARLCRPVASEDISRVAESANSNIVMNE